MRHTQKEQWGHTQANEAFKQQTCKKQMRYNTNKQRRRRSKGDITKALAKET